MSPSAPEPTPPRSALRLCILWTLGILILPGLLLLFHAIENWRGERAWAAEKARLQATGFSLNFADYLTSPADVPDADNVAAASFYKKVYDPHWEKRNSPFELPQDLLRAEGRYTDWATGLAPDFPGIQASIVTLPRGETDEVKSAQAVLQLLSMHDADLAETRTAAARPHVRFPFVSEGGVQEEQPHLKLCQSLANLLSLRSRALIAARRPDEAFQDWKLLIRQVEIARQPNLLSQLVEQSLITQSLTPVWYGLARGSWSDAHLAEINAIYSRIDPARNCITCIKGEFCLFLTTMERFVGDRGAADRELGATFQMLAEVGAPFDAPSEASALFARSVVALVPPGWLRQNQVAHSLSMRATIKELEAATTPPGLFKPSALTSRTHRPPSSKPNAYNYLSHAANSTFVVVVDNSRQIIASIAMARTAIQLEQHRRRTGALPVTLTQLAPLPPVDPITGNPLGFTRLDDKRFKLWSVALNAKDDGGTMGPKRPRALDWLWLSYIVKPESKTSP